MQDATNSTGIGIGMGIGSTYFLQYDRLVLSFDIRLRHTAADRADDRRPERLGGAFHPFPSNGFSESRCVVASGRSREPCGDGCGLDFRFGGRGGGCLGWKWRLRFYGDGWVRHFVLDIFSRVWSVLISR